MQKVVSVRGVALLRGIRNTVLLSLLLVALAVGCSSGESTPVGGGLPFEGVQLKLLVAEDPALADAIAKFQGEWKAQTGATLEILQCSQAELLDQEQLSADAVIYPSHCLGPLEQRGLVAALPREFLADAQLAWTDVFEAVRLREVARDGKVLAVPLGSPVLVCYYRADLFRQFKLKPPGSWEELIELTQFFGNRQRLDQLAPHDQNEQEWEALVAPQEDHGDALLLLAWAAPYAKHPDFFSGLFDLQTMTPRIDSPPFVRALDELKSIAPRIKRAGTPAQVRDAFWQGRCAMAIGWASAADNRAPSSNDVAAGVEAAFCPLPGAREVYHPVAGAWEKRPTAAATVPLLGIAGRLGSVVKDSAQISAARQLLAALSSPQWSAQISAASPATTLFRASHLKAPREWTEPAVNQAAASQYAEVVQATLSQQDYLSALPLAGRDDYLQALDTAVQAALAEEKPSQEALAACAKQWSDITQQRGHKQQQEAYRRSVEVGP